MARILLAYFPVFRSAPLSPSPTPPPTGGDHILHENSLKYIKYSCVIFIQSWGWHPPDEKSVCAICIPDLISASLTDLFYGLAHIRALQFPVWNNNCGIPCDKVSFHCGNVRFICAENAYCIELNTWFVLCIVLLTVSAAVLLAVGIWL